jgi:hypothetical protein
MSNAQTRQKSTPPKGRATPRRPRTVEQNNRRATAGWIAVGLAIAAAFAVLVYLAGDAVPSSPHSGAAASSFPG